MTATTQDIKAPIMSPAGTVWPSLFALPMETNCQVFANTPVFSDAAGNAVDGSNTVNPPLLCWGMAVAGVNNLNSNAPYGAAAAQNVQIMQAAAYYNQDGSISLANMGQPAYAVDNQTCTLNPVASIASTVWLPFLGTIMPPGVGQSGIFFTTNTQVPVFLGYPNPMMLTLAAKIPVTLANIQAQTSGAAFNLGPVMPANARLLDIEVSLTTPLTGGGETHTTLAIQGGADAAGTLISIPSGAADLTTAAAASVFSGFGATNGGSNPYTKRGGQQLKATLTQTGGTLAGLTAGAFTVTILYTIIP
jgi:hypothetical protein